MKKHFKPKILPLPAMMLLLVDKVLIAAVQLYFCSCLLACYYNHRDGNLVLHFCKQVVHTFYGGTLPIRRKLKILQFPKSHRVRLHKAVP